MTRRKRKEEAIVVFTARSPGRIVREGGSQAWRLSPIRARQCTWLVCTQNQHNPNHDFSDATEPHGSAFLLGKISEVRKSSEGASDRWFIGIREFARIDVSDCWDHGRYPIRYTSLEQLGIQHEKLTFQPVDSEQESERQPESPSIGLTIMQAKIALAASYGLRPDNVEITIRA
jgi:hypothetical protein